MGERSILFSLHLSYYYNTKKACYGKNIHNTQNVVLTKRTFRERNFESRETVFSPPIAYKNNRPLSYLSYILKSTSCLTPSINGGITFSIMQGAFCFRGYSNLHYNLKRQIDVILPNSLLFDTYSAEFHIHTVIFIR